LAGDRLVDRFGEVAIVRVGGALIAIGMTAGLAVARPAAMIIGFAIAGLGAAPMFPLVFHAAGNVPGVSTGHGLAAVATLSRVGFLVAPPIVGALGDAVGLRSSLLLAPAAGLAVIAFAPIVRTPAGETSPSRSS
jgi:fucose permease